MIYLFSAVDPDARELLTYIERLEAEISPRLSVSKVDIYKSDGIARRLGISQFPAVAMVENGRIVKTMTDHEIFHFFQCVVLFHVVPGIRFFCSGQPVYTKCHGTFRSDILYRSGQQVGGRRFLGFGHALEFRFTEDPPFHFCHI